ncbi:MAG: hypothetical protein ACKOQM_14575 [Novosphingobium sp.]
MTIRTLFIPAALLVVGTATFAQESFAPPLGEVMVAANPQNAPYYRQDRPLVGLRRTADAAVMAFTVTSDSRDYATRKQEIQAVLTGAIDKAKAAGFELVFGNFRLERLTRENAEDVNYEYGGRVDTSKVTVMARMPLSGSAADTEKKLLAFLKTLKKSGRAVLETPGLIQLTVINPEQYRDQVLKLVAEDARHNAAIFGPEFTFGVTGTDQPVVWTQVSSTEVFLFVPYRYTINPK